MSYELGWCEALGVDDGEQIAALMNSVLESDTIIGYPVPLSAEQARAHVAGLSADLAQQQSQLLLARSQQQIVGMVSLVLQSLPNCRHVASLSGAIIHARFRGGALLRAALLQIVERCHKLSVEVLTIDARAGTRAEAIWRVYGFLEYGRLQDYARVGPTSFAGVYMYQRVSDLERHLQGGPK